MGLKSDIAYALKSKTDCTQSPRKQSFPREIPDF